MTFMITSFQINGQPCRSLNLDVNTYNIEIHIFFFYRPHDNISQSRYQHWCWCCWCLNWYPLYYAVVALNYWREESVKWTSFVIMYICQAMELNTVKPTVLYWYHATVGRAKAEGKWLRKHWMSQFGSAFSRWTTMCFRLSSCSKCSESQWL